MRGVQKFVPVGSLDSDTDVVYLRDGKYRDASNISHITDSTGSTQAIIPMKGNTSAFDLGSVATQNKTVRVYTSDLSATPDPGFSTILFFSNGVQFGAPTATTATYTVNWSRNGTVAAQASAIRTAIQVWDASAIVTAGATYIDITLSIVSGGEWSITAMNGLATPTSLTFNTLNEAYDSSLVGELHPIGSYDLLGDLYVWSTTGTNLSLKSTLTISSIALSLVGGRNLYRITFSSAHGFTAGQSINLVGNHPSSLDGTWIISSSGLTTTAIVLDDYYSHVLPVSSSTIPTELTTTLYANSIGEVGIGQYTASSDSWTYTRLGRTKQWGFNTKKQCDTYCEQTSVKSSIYWTDDYNVPRVIYYVFDYDVNNVRAAFVQDGIISTINSSGLYTYETINQESRLQLTESGARISFVQQFQSGGQINAGNWRYAARFLTEGLTATTLSQVTNPINVFSADVNGAAALIIGDDSSTITSKINQLEVTGIQPGLFKYVELIGVNYVGNSVVGYNIKRESLSNTQTSIIINHTGTETEITDFDLGLLNQVFEQIATARNIDVIDKRMILSNLTTRQRSDFTNWAQTIQHSVSRKSLAAVRSATGGTIVAGEYQLPENVNNYVGYMQNETIRFGVEVKIKNGGWTEAFHVQDIKIDCDTTVSRRISALPDFNLTANSGVPGADDICFSAYVSFGITTALLDYRIDGTRVRDLIDGIRFVRAEVNPTVLACGMIVPSVARALVDATYEIEYDPAAGTIDEFGEFPFISGRVSGVPPGGANPLYDNAEFNAMRERRLAAFYSPDIQFGHTNISFLPGDVVKIYGNPFYTSFVNAGGASYSDVFGQWSGRTSATGTVITPISVSPTAIVSMTYGEGLHTFPSTRGYRKQAAFLQAGPGNYSVNYIAQSLVIETTSAAGFYNPVTVPAQEDRAFYYSQYIRPLADQYGDVDSTIYVSTGHYLAVSAGSTPTTESVFGGDTFTQQNFLRHRTFAQEGIDFSGLPAAVTPQTQGFGGGVSFYCQNKINAQMKGKSPSQTGNIYPGISTTAWLDSIANTDGNNGEAYQEGYTIRNEVQSTIAFDPNQTDTSDQPARIRWSAIKPQGSPSDQYRVYLFADFHDLDQANGEIVHHANGNGELLTWQQRAFMRQYFNTRGTLSVKGITEILIGDGSVMSRDGVTVSRLGSKHKWSVIKGKSQGGNDVFYWLNTELKKALRFGYDGTVSIADVKGMQSFFANNLTWVDTHDTPADGSGICGYWDDRFANAGWSIRGIKNIDRTWSSSTLYSTIGTEVLYSPSTPYSTFNKTGEIFLNKNISNFNITPVANYSLPNTVVSISGTSVLTITTLTPHLLVTGDEVKFRNISGLSTDINNSFLTVTVTGASTFTVTVSALTNNYTASSGSIVEVNPKYWTLVEHTNNLYYNEYTILFNEFKNAFTTFATPMPKIYLKWQDTFLAPRPISPEYKIYQFNKGDYLTWWLHNGVSQTERGYIQWPVNEISDETKWFEAVGVDSEITPIRFEFETKNHESFLVDTEFESQEDSFFAPVKNDSTGTGVNSNDTTSLYGKYMLAKMFFEVNVYQKLVNVTTKFRISPRTKTK